MHAGEVSSGRRAHGGKFLAASGETIMPAGILNEKCTPAWRTTAAAGGHTVVNSSLPAARRPYRRGYKTKNARRHGEQRQRPAGTRCQIPAGSAKTIMPAGILNEKCTPVRRATAATGGHTVPNSPPPAPRRPCRRGYKTKNARR
ncbi:hypothetical protein [Bianquea renquensis]|uniref:Uncharacterized protein n=1 Tax=Bianquea renquensis TaxID=2763661 RepID=A0A926DTP3_9FIRM|nr:hypothetical protein [Bianquea renquensis]MBC8543547.1 hypothetical protein [Bianquea renquensis]